MPAHNIKNKPQPAAESFKLGNELVGLLSIFIGLLFILSLATFDVRDPWLNHAVSGNAVVHNKAGLFGAYAGGFLFDVFGYAAWLVPALFCFIGARRILGVPVWPWWRWTGVCLLFIVFSFVGASKDASQTREVVEQGRLLMTNHGGGMLGDFIYNGLVGWLSPTGAWLIWTLCLLFSIQVMVGFSWLVVVAQFARFLIQTSTKMAEDLIKEHQDKKQREVIELESDAANGKHFALPSSLFGRKALQGAPAQGVSTDATHPDIHAGIAHNTTPTNIVVNGMVVSSPDSGATDNDAPWLNGHSGERPQRYQESSGSNDTHDYFHQKDPSDENSFSFDGQQDEEPREEKKGLLRSLFTSKKAMNENLANESNALDLPDLPPWVDDFEHDAMHPASDKALRPDFSTVEQTPPTEAKQAQEKDALLSILENYETSLQEQEVDTSVQFSQELLHPSTTDGATPSHVIDEAPNAKLAEGYDEQPARDASRDFNESSRQDTQKEPNHNDFHEEPHESSTFASQGQGAAIPIRDKALDSVIETVAPAQQNDDKNPLPRKKARLPLPPLDLIEAIPQSGSKASYAVLESKAQDLMTCLADFGIQGELVGITPGPVVTMFEVRPAPGVRVARIANLSDDLALALKAVAVRIQAPVPGTDTVGIEIPNEQREVVCLRQILASETFANSKSFLSIALGKDIAGHPAVADLATMPHLLVAGATGAGKSVGINSIILSLLYKATPDEVRLLLVDPKRVEMAIYADLPHLVHPVVTEMQLAKNALDWAVREMDDRYTILAKAQVRNITDYNAKIKEHMQKPIPEMEGLEHMPYLVIIIDELADLMLTAAKEVETSIVRLAQLARAAGIHLILATQRPSVDVVTGIIKANFPCRIAFQVTSKHDSRTILDSVGAEHLLGKGDMLFKPSGGRFQRMHGAFVNDKNVKKVVDYWKRLQKPQFEIDFAEFGTAGGDASGNGQSDIYDDPVYGEAVDFVCEQGKASISLIQRRFRIGFNKAARIIEQMEVDGIVGPQEGSKPRTVLR